MTKAVALLPYVYKPYLEACLATIKIPKEQLLLVDGTLPEDGGFAWAFNRGIEFMEMQEADYLIVLNPALRFGEPGGMDMLEKLNGLDSNMVFFNDLAWHCCAIGRVVIDAIGKLDTNFSPVYFEDVDYDLRYSKFFGDKGIRRLTVDVSNESYGHSVKLGGQKPDINYLITYFATKWGVHPSAAKALKSYDHPFNNPDHSLKFWPPANGDKCDE